MIRCLGPMLAALVICSCKSSPEPAPPPMASPFAMEYPPVPSPRGVVWRSKSGIEAKSVDEFLALLEGAGENPRQVTTTLAFYAGTPWEDVRTAWAEGEKRGLVVQWVAIMCLEAASPNS